MNTKDMLTVVTVLVITVVAVAILAMAGPTAVAHAEPAQQFTLQLTATKPGGPVEIRLKLRAYDTTGAVPPSPTDYYVRLPAGMSIRREFLSARWYCDGPALRDALDAHPSGTPFADRVANLKPFIRELAASRARADRKALANVRVCDRARLGDGTGLIDARRVTRVLSEPIPIKFSEFWSRGPAPGAIAGFTILGSADEHAPIVKRYPVTAGVHAAITDSIVRDPTADGLYDYKLLLPTGPIGGFDISIAEVDTTAHALKLAKGTCLRQDGRGRCTARQAKDLYSFVLPSCPAAGQLSALMYSGYAAPTPGLTTTLQLPCPSYR